MSDDDIFDVAPNTAPVLETDADGRLFYDGERAGFSRLDRSYIAVASQAFAQNRDVALIYPSPPTHVQVPILLAVGFQLRDRAPALYVSNRSGIREQYFNVGIGPKFHPGDRIEPDPLGEFTAPMVRTGDGESLSYIPRHKPNAWDPSDPHRASLVHTTFGKKVAQTLSDDLPLSGFVLDFTTGLLDGPEARDAYAFHADQRDVPRVMVFDSPNHPYLRELERSNAAGETNVLFWGWSAPELEGSPRELLEPVADVPSDDADAAADGGSLPSPFVDSVASLQNLRQGIQRTVTEVPYGDLEPIAKRTYERIGELARFPERTPDEYSGRSRNAISSAYFLYMYMDTLALSVEFHDSLSALDDDTSWGTSDTLRGKVDSLRERADVLESDVTGSGPVLGDVCELFDKMVEALTVHNPKADALVEELRAARDRGEEVTVFTATRKQESLLQSFVGEKTELGHEDDFTEILNFQSLYDPHTVPRADVAIFPGVPTKSHYPAVQNGSAGEQRFLTYTWESDRLDRRLTEVFELADARAGSGVQRFTARELNFPADKLDEYADETSPRRPTGYTRLSSESEPDSAGGTEDPVMDEENSRRSNARQLSESERVGASPTRTDQGLSFDLEELAPEGSIGVGNDDIESELEFDDGDDRETIDGGRASEENGPAGGGTDIDAFRVEFVDDTWMYERPRGLVWALDTEGGGSVSRERRAAHTLERGDRVLMIQEDSRRDVFEYVVDKIHAECRGPFQEYLTMLDLWNTGLDNVVEYFREMEEMMNQNPREPNIDLSMRHIAEFVAEELSEYAGEEDAPNVDREAQSVHQWLTRAVLGPSSPAPIRAMGELYEVEILANHAREIYTGLQEVRRLHQRVGHKLGEILFSAGQEDADEWLLEECGLKVGDVQDATVVKRVADVDGELQTVSNGELGRLQRE